MSKVNTYKVENGLFLHASSVNTSKGALLFLGHSSSGKSTICRLLSKRFPILADDRVWVCTGDGEKWFARDGGFHLQRRREKLKMVPSYEMFPLFSVIRIFKAEKSEMQPISPMESCCHLIDAVFEVIDQRKHDDWSVRKKWFSQVADIARKYPGFHLYFKKDSFIIDLIKGDSE